MSTPCVAAKMADLFVTVCVIVPVVKLGVTLCALTGAQMIDNDSSKRRIDVGFYLHSHYTLIQ